MAQSVKFLLPKHREPRTHLKSWTQWPVPVTPVLGEKAETVDPWSSLTTQSESVSFQFIERSHLKKMKDREQWRKTLDGNLCLHSPKNINRLWFVENIVFKYKKTHRAVVQGRYLLELTRRLLSNNRPPASSGPLPLSDVGQDRLV